MFTVIYSFKVKGDSIQSFENSWHQLTELIYEYEGSLGSRLHVVNNSDKGNHYLAYAQWPDKATWENSGSRLPKSAEEIRAVMKSSCEQIETLFELEVISDLLASAIKK